MTAPAIPREYEWRVYERSVLGQSSRSVSAWLAEKCGVAASHSAVSSCVKRIGKRYREIEEAPCSVRRVDSKSAAELAELHRFFRAARCLALRRKDTHAEIRALVGEADVVFKQLEDEWAAMTEPTRPGHGLSASSARNIDDSEIASIQTDSEPNFVSRFEHPREVRPSRARHEHPDKTPANALPDPCQPPFQCPATSFPNANSFEDSRISASQKK